MYKHLLIAVFALFLLGCKEKPNCPSDTWKEDYTLDVSNVKQGGIKAGAIGFHHNKMAVFPLDFGSRNRILDTLGAKTIKRIQTKNTCEEGNGRTELAEDHSIPRSIDHPEFGGVTAYKDVAHITGIHLELPYFHQTRNAELITYKPHKLAFAFHIKDKGWVMHYTCIEPVMDDAAQKGTAQIQVDESNVDAIGILFNDLTILSKITYTVKKTCPE